MTTIKYINYINLIGGTILFWTYIRSGPLYYDYYLIIGLGLIIWYNWETLKQFKGQKKQIKQTELCYWNFDTAFWRTLHFRRPGND